MKIKPVLKKSVKKDSIIVKHNNVSYFFQVDLILYIFNSANKYFLHLNKIERFILRYDRSKPESPIGYLWKLQNKKAKKKDFLIKKLSTFTVSRHSSSNFQYYSLKNL